MRLPRVLFVTAAIALVAALFGATGNFNLSADELASHSLATEDPFLSLAGRADAAAIVTPLSQRSFWQSGLIMTTYQLSPTRTLFGITPGTLSLTEPGGEVGDLGLTVSDAASFSPGTSYVVLLTQGVSGLEVMEGASGCRPLGSDAISDTDLLTGLNKVAEARSRKETK